MYGKEAFITAFKVSTVQGDEQSTAGPYIAHLESQYSWAQIRLAAYSQGSRPSAQVPRPYTEHQPDTEVQLVSQGSRDQLLGTARVQRLSGQGEHSSQLPAPVHAVSQGASREL